jgi:hypothetical protein
LDYILTWSTNPKAQRLGEAVWVNYRHLIAEMPLLGLRSKSAVANRIEKLRRLDLIKTRADENQRVFVQLTERFHEIVCFRGSQPPVHQNERGVQTDELTVHEGEHLLVNQNSKSKQTPSASKMPPCPHEKIIEIYHKRFPLGRKVLLSRYHGSNREKQLTQRWRETPKHQSLEFWETYFSAASGIPWMTGNTERGWVADFGYLTKRAGFDKTLEQVVEHE